jgi:CRP-like cAMP-binding protein
MSIFNPDAVFEKRLAPKGSIVVTQGGDGREAFLIQRGSVKVYTTNQRGGRADLGTLGAGQIFGEMALTVGGPRTATVEAAEDCTLIVITRETLNAKLKKSDPTIQAIMGMLMQRLQRGNDALLNKAGSIDELLDMVRHIYNNLQDSLPDDRRQSLDNLVRPKLEDLLAAIKTFQGQK